MNRKYLYIVILAGGTGTRFWPLSRHHQPKQFLKITGDESLLQQTVGRVSSHISSDHIIVVGSRSHAGLIKGQLRRFKIPSSNILFEPEGKNTAPSICWAAARLHKINPDSVMAVLPSDHLILNPKKFLQTLKQAVALAEQDYLVTMGIVPTRPETGYGYLQTMPARDGKKAFLKVSRFVEKPSLAKAQNFLKTKKYLWNSGMFVWKTRVIIEEFYKYLPGVLALLQKYPSGKAFERIWKKLPSISIDYGILEKSKRVAAVAGQEIGWSDLGSWEALAQILNKDKKGNILKGDGMVIDCKETLLWGHKKLIAAVGLDNVIVVDTPDALLVCRKDLSQQVKEIVNALKKNNRPEYLSH